MDKRNRYGGVVETVRLFGVPWNILNYDILRKRHNILFLKHQQGWTFLGKPMGRLAGQRSWALCKRMVMKMGLGWELSWGRSPAVLWSQKSSLGLVYCGHNPEGQLSVPNVLARLLKSLLFAMWCFYFLFALPICPALGTTLASVWQKCKCIQNTPSDALPSSHTLVCLPPQCLLLMEALLQPGFCPAANTDLARGPTVITWLCSFFSSNSLLNSEFHLLRRYVPECDTRLFRWRKVLQEKTLNHTVGVSPLLQVCGLHSKSLCHEGLSTNPTGDLFS